MFEDPHVSNRMFGATAEGFWDPEQVELVHPYVARYLAEAPAVARDRGQAFSQLVGRAFPAIPLGEPDVAALEAALAGDLPTVLRRKWEDRLDDLRLTTVELGVMALRVGPDGPGHGPLRPTQQLRVAVEHGGDRAVLEDLADRPREQRGDREQVSLSN